MRLVYIISRAESLWFFFLPVFQGFFLVSPGFFCSSCSQNYVGIDIYVLQYIYYYKLIPCEPHESNYALQLRVFKIFKAIL